MLKIGHRGASAYMPENTIESFKKAVALGVDAIEFDIRKTRDKEIIVFHDETLEKLNGSTNRIQNLSLEQIKELDVKGQSIPTLQEALDFINQNNILAVIDFKESGMEQKVFDRVKERDMNDSVIFTSSIGKVLINIRQISKYIDLAFGYKRPEYPVSTALRLKCDYIMPAYEFLTPDTIKRAHSKGLQVVTWTINNREIALQYAEMGVDGITSDKPDVLEGL